MKLMVDTDIGVDDCFALMMAMSNTNVDILAITAVFGNSTLPQTVSNIGRLLRLMERQRIPVYAGAAGPLVTELQRVDASNYHGLDGLGDCPDADPCSISEDGQCAVKGKHAAEAIVHNARLHPGEITMVCLGPLTNLALATRIEPKLGSLLKHLYIMGGNIHAMGNVPNYILTNFSTAEYNFHNDPEAAQIILTELTCPTTIVPWEMFIHQKPSEDFIPEFTSKTDTRKGRFVKAILKNPLELLKNHKWPFGFCDELAMASAIDPTVIVESEMHSASVELRGLYTRGQVAIDHMNFDQDKRRVQFVTRMRMERVERMLLDSLS